MDRTFRLLVVSVAAVSFVLSGAGWTFWPRTAITRENAAKIRPGMKAAEVAILLGGPARDETGGPVEAECLDGPNGWLRWAFQKNTSAVWKSDSAWIDVWFADNTVTASVCLHVKPILRDRDPCEAVFGPPPRGLHLPRTHAP